MNITKSGISHLAMRVAEAITLLLLFCSVSLLIQPKPSQNNQTMNNKSSILIHLSQGPENPTVAALAFLIARTAVENGHEVTLFFAGDAVQLMKDEVLNNLTGLGTGKLIEHYKVLKEAGCHFYLSGMSSKSRGITENDMNGKKVTFASPTVLLNLALENDKMFTY